jgi:pimeloyl-ACP methyl ester carboxylesterase
MDRRRFTRSLFAVAGASVTGSIAGCSACEDFIDAIGGTCPDDPAESGGIEWTPDVMHPVFWGFQELTPTQGAPVRLRIFYPTYEGFTDGPPILKMCVIRWPVVIFFHGQPPQGCNIADYFRQFSLIAAVLARSGYVVIVPEWAASRPSEPGVPAELDGLAEWARTEWEHSRWVDQRREALAVGGHSYGGLMAGRFAEAHPEVSAYFSLSAPWNELGGGVIQYLGAPAFFMWGNGLFFEDLDVFSPNWSTVPGIKYAGVFEGEHFDFITDQPGCGEPRGACPLIGAAAADLVALFLARHNPVLLSNPDVPVDLQPPAAPLTPEQQFFAGGRLAGLTQLEDREGCRIALRWEDGPDVGSRDIGPG